MRIGPFVKVLMTCVAAVLVAACSSSKTSTLNGSTPRPGAGKSTGAPFVVGVSTGITGPAAAFGAQEAAMAKVLFAHINATGGIDGHQVKLIVKDNGNSPQQAVLDAQAFVAAHANVMMFGPTAGVMTAVQPFAAHTLIVDFGSGYVPPTPSNVFSVSPYDASPLGATMRFLKAQGDVTVGLINSNDTAGEIAAKEVRTVLTGSYGRSLGMKYSSAVTFDPTSPDVTPELSQLLSSHPQAIISWVSGTPAVAVAKDFTQLVTSNIPLIVSWANGSLTFARSTTSFNPTNLYAPVFKAILWQQMPSSDFYAKLGKQLNSQLETAIGQPLDEGGVLAYDPVQMVVRALKEGGTSLSAQVRTLESVRNYQGLEGTYTITPTDHKGEPSLLNNSLVIAKIVNGGYQVVAASS